MRSPTRLLAISLLLGLARLAAAACGDHPLDAAEMTAARAAGDLACPCVEYADHAAYVGCVATEAAQRTAAHVLHPQCKRALVKCAARSTCGKFGLVTCCRTTAAGVTKCRVTRDAAHCTRPRHGSACVGRTASCCDACGAGGCSSHTTTTTTTLPVSCASAAEDTFDTIQQRIFGYHGCAVSSCHGPLAQGNLDLRDGAAYGSLVGVPAVNPVAARAGKLRVAPGNAAASFLSQKLHGTLATGEGARMPYVGTSLTPAELAFVDAWITAGAAQTGIVPQVPCLPPLEYVPAEAPAPPAGGYQMVLDGPWLQPGQEQEGCFWIPVPSSTDFYTGKWEFVLNPGTHHFAVYTNRDDVPLPPSRQWLLNDFGCFREANYGANLSGAPQAPYFVDAYPAGVARVLRAGSFIGLNAHYHNSFDVPIQIKVWTNIYPYPGTPQHVAQTLTSLDTTFTIDVAPFTQKAQHGRFVNDLGKPMSFVNLSGHMHKRGLRFTAWRSNGAKLYENFDWAHPLVVLYDPPLVLAPGDWIDYECLHDNGVTRPVKLDAFGKPTHLRFGVTTDDEMCILPGVYYTD